MQNGDNDSLIQQGTELKHRLVSLEVGGGLMTKLAVL